MEKCLVEEIKRFNEWAKSRGHKNNFNNFIYWRNNVRIKRGELE